MKDRLRDLLTPSDDGRAFTDAVMLRAAGALARRRAAAEAETGEPVWTWLVRWAHPWVVAALIVVALMGMFPALRTGVPTAQQPMTEDTIYASTLPDDVVAIAVASTERE